MGCKVYANNMSIACKAADGKSIAAFPDVCFTPPTAPPTPPGIPIPYPNTGMASDTANGSKSVLIGGKEVMLKNKSYFKTSTGDEAGNTPKKGIITSKIKGKLCFVSWSMNVKFEGLNIPRHLDLMGHNEASDPTNVMVWPYTDHMSAAEIDKCSQTYTKFKLHKHKDKDCDGGQQSHHPAMNACFEYPRKKPTDIISNYKKGDAPAICLQDSFTDSIHYNCTQAQNKWSGGLTKPPTYEDLRAKMKEILMDKKTMKNMTMTDDESECIMKSVDGYMGKLNPKVDAKTTLLKPK